MPVTGPMGRRLSMAMSPRGNVRPGREAVWNRFQKWLSVPEALAIRQERPHPRSTIQRLLPTVSASRGIMTPVV